MTCVDYSQLTRAFEDAADRVWYFTAYQRTNGSLYVPESVFHALGAVPKGNGTYCWENGESNLWVYGDYTRRPEQYAAIGTVNVSRAYYTAESPAWPCPVHYDYNRTDPKHEIAHLHPDNSSKWDMHTEGSVALGYLKKGLSKGFSSFIQKSEDSGVDIFKISGI